MKLGSQPVNALGPTTFASGTPTVMPTNPNSPFAKLVAKNEVGQIVQQWLLLQNKCTLGSASSCALRCQLSGIAPYHALLVMGARQVFIRALAPKLARNGVMVNELLMTEDQSTFEIAGHQFELIRNVKTNEPTSSDNSASQNKMKFTLARPMEIGQVRQPTAIPTQIQPAAVPSAHVPSAHVPAPTARTIASPAADQNQASFERLQPKADSTELQPQWITDLIQSAMLPLERQLNGIIEPLAAVQNELDKRAKLERKRRNRTGNRRRASDRDITDRDMPETREPENNLLERNGSVQFAAERIAAEQFAREQFEREQFAREQLEREQLARERELLERERSVLNAAFTTQIDVQPQISNISEPLIVPVISPEVQAQLARQSETLDSLNARLTEVKSNLGSLERIVSENFVTVIGATSAPATTPEPVNEALNRITLVTDQLKASVANQLNALTSQLDDVRNNLGSLQQTVSENLASTNDLRSAPETLNRITSVTDQLKASVANQLNGLTSQLDEVKNNLGSLQQTVSENLASTNDLRSALEPASPEPASPEPASQEALQRLTDVANQLSHLLQEMNARQISSVQSFEQSEVARREQFRANELSELEWREQLRTREQSDLEWREQLKAQIGELRATITATESSIQSATESSIEKATQVARAAQAEILAATEAAILKVSELRSSTPKGNCPTSAALIANGHLKATIESSPTTRGPVSQIPVSQIPVFQAPATQAPLQSFPAPISTAPAVAAQVTASPVYESPVNVAPAVIAAPVIAAPVIAAQVNAAQVNAAQVNATSEFTKTGFATEEPVNGISESPAFVADVAEEIVEPIQQSVSNVAAEPELNQFAQYSWNPEPTENSAYGFNIEQNPAPTPAPFESAWEMPATPSPTPAIEYSNASANFIEETIEEAPMLEEAASSALPSWWTEDDKTQFKDDSSASAALSSAWNISNFTKDSPTDPSSISIGVASDYSEGFANPSEDSGYSASAWDVEVKRESSQVELETPANLIEPQDTRLDDIAPFEALPANSPNETAREKARSETPSSETPSSETQASEPLNADDESYELSSLLERFGIAREPAKVPARESTHDSAAYDANELRKDRKPVLKRESIQDLQPMDSATIDQTEVVRVQEPIAAPEIEPEPISSSSPQPAFEPPTSPSAEAGEEESIEDYMKRLMARMRGGSLEEEPKPVPAPVVKAPAPIQSADSLSSSKIPLPGAATERAPSSTTGPFNPEEYVPKALAPEKTRNMAAMRELANTSARSAIQVSARRRYGTAIALKLAIALIGLVVGITLVMINGLNVNIGLIATVASFLVALIWGFDAFSTLKPLLYAAVETLDAVPPTTPEPEEPAQI